MATPMPVVDRIDIEAMVSPLTSDKGDAILALKRVSETETGELTISEEKLASTPLWWSKIRKDCRMAFSEFFGTLVLVLFGNGVVAQVVLSENKKGDYQSISWGWG